MKGDDAMVKLKETLARLHNELVAMRETIATQADVHAEAHRVIEAIQRVLLPYRN